MCRLIESIARSNLLLSVCNIIIILCSNCIVESNRFSLIIWLGFGNGDRERMNRTETKEERKGNKNHR